MTSVATEKAVVPAERPRRAAWFAVPEVWGTFAIATMWVAVLFVGVYGADFVSTNPGGDSTTIPSAVFVAFFAFLATSSVAKRVYGCRSPNSAG